MEEPATRKSRTGMVDGLAAEGAKAVRPKAGANQAAPPQRRPSIVIIGADWRRDGWRKHENTLGTP